MALRLSDKYNALTPLNKFIFKGAFLYLIWLAFRKYTYVYGLDGAFTHNYSNLYLLVSDFIIRMIGYSPVTDYDSSSMYIPGGNGIIIQYGCLAIGIMFHFVIFIVAYPGSIKGKVWFIPLGLIVIFLVNSVRIALLAWIDCFKSEYFDLFHNFMFSAIIYAIVFVMCLYFVKTVRQK